MFFNTNNSLFYSLTQTIDASQISQDFILREISQTLSQRKKLHVQVSKLETELTCLEDPPRDPCYPGSSSATTTPAAAAISSSSGCSGKVLPNAVLSRQVATLERLDSKVIPSGVVTAATVTVLSPPMTDVSRHNTSSSSSCSDKSPGRHHTPSSAASSAAANANKSRHRSRNQEWPAVPDVGKIEEKNPELLAMKILETGRQIEAGRIPVLPPGQLLIVIIFSHKYYALQRMV